MEVTMKKFIRLLAIVLTLVTLCASLSGCETTADKMAALSGTWIMIEQDSVEQATALLENIDLYEQELALADATSLKYAWIFEFDEEGNFRQADDIKMTKQLVREFYEGVFDDLYEGRASLAGLYEQDLSVMSKEEMQLFYAGLYGYDTYEALMDRFVESAYKYDEWKDYRNGYFTIKGDKLDMVDREAGYDSYLIAYKLNGDTLTLTYSDGVEVYTRVK